MQGEPVAVDGGRKQNVPLSQDAHCASARVARGQSILKQEAEALSQLADALDFRFAQAVSLLGACTGHVVVTGVGKSGHVGQKFAATLSSIGIPAFFLHAGEAMHGDLGQIRSGDVVVALSHSGGSGEIVRLLPHLKKLGSALVAITGQPQSALGLAADLCLSLGAVAEACPLNLVPTVSTTLMLGLSDALAMALFHERDNLAETYRARHPGGMLGRHLKKAGEVMRVGDKLPLIATSATLGEAIWVMTATPGRPGAVLIVDAEGLLAGLFTDGDLRRLLEQDAFQKDRPLDQVMHRSVRTIAPACSVRDAIQIMHEHQVDQLVVVSEGGRPVGLLDVQDVLSLPL